MKLKKVEALIKKSKSVAIVETEGAIWIGNEKCMYPTYFSYLDFDTLMTMFDLDTEKRESITEVPSELIAGASTEDTCPGEILLQRIPMQITYHGHPLSPYIFEDKLVYVDPRVLEPAADAKDGIELYLRQSDDGRLYIAIKSGMLLVGLAEPALEIDEMFLNELKKLYDKSSAAFKAAPSSPDPQVRL